MKIVSVKAWQVGLPLREGRYTWSSGHFIEVFDSTVVEIETDAGISGFAECCPLGSVYLPSFARGVRAGLAEIAAALLGADPRNLADVHLRMENALKGHPYVKAPVDIACWDILGKVAGLPVYTLLGGRQQDSVALYRAISQQSPEEMAKKIAGYRDEGYTKFQLKVGADVDTDIARIRATRAILDQGEQLVADANTGWSRQEAIRVANAVRDLDVFIEQPCPTYEESVSVRRRTSLPFILDEVIDDPATLVQALSDDAMDCVNIKISKVGGLTTAKLMRDLCVDAGIHMTIEDTWGGDITTATIAHLAASTPEKFCFSATDFNSYGTVDIAAGAPKRVKGRMAPSDAPGLGITPDFNVLGDAILSVR